MTSHLANYSNQQAIDDNFLNGQQLDAFEYFQNETNTENGLVVDKTQTNAPSSIAAVAFVCIMGSVILVV